MDSGPKRMFICLYFVESSPPLDPLPPISELLVYSMPHTIHIHDIDDDSLLQIFSHYRLQDGDNWHLRHTWRRLAHVCQKWRYLVYLSPSYLDMCLLLTNHSPSINTLNHLPPLPLIIDYSDTNGIRTMARKYDDNIHLGLEQNGRIRRVTLRASSSSLCRLLERMNTPFPRLEDLSLLSTTTEETNVTSVVLPESLHVPFLNRLSLQGIGLPKLSSMITLSTLSLTHIRDFCYFAPGNLITQLQGLLCLEELSIGFAIPIPLPSSERKLLPTPIPPVTLPALRWLTFRGMSVYLDNLVAQIKTPLLEQLNLTLFFELAFTLVNLAGFIHTTEGLRCLAAQVIFNKNKSASIYAGHHEERVTGNRGLRVNVICEPRGWQMDSATQVCSAIGKVLSTVEGLTLDVDVNAMMSIGWNNTLYNMLWHELLLPFMGVKKLHIGSSLTFELFQALESVAASGSLVLELLPELQELEIEGFEAFSGFIKTRESIGRPVHISYQRGPIVPQKRYMPHISSDRGRYVEVDDLEPAIFFYMQNTGESGIPLKDALDGRFARLVGRDDYMFEQRQPSISVRINWPGYQPWSRQIPTRDFRSPPGPITRSKLAKNVAKSVGHFISEHTNRPMEEDSDPTWAVGPRKIAVADLVLVRLDHVSRGSWQTHLQLLHPLAPRS